MDKTIERKPLKRVQIRTKNHSANPLRGNIYSPRSTIVRLGSLTPLSNAYPNRKSLDGIIEINTVNAVQNSRNKLRMKKCFAEANVKQAEWWDSYQALAHDENKLPYPIVAKKIVGFKGIGMQLLQNKTELEEFIEKEKNLNSYFFEKFYNYAREYRLHVGNGEVFMVWRKLRTADAEQRWFFNNSNCNWVGEDHKLFHKPKNWKEIENAAINAMKSTGLLLGAADIRVQSGESDKSVSDFIVCEVNSAPALGEHGIEVYKKQISKIINSYV